MRQIDSKQETARGKLSDKALDRESTMIKKKRRYGEGWKGMEWDDTQRREKKSLNAGLVHELGQLR